MYINFYINNLLWDININKKIIKFTFWVLFGMVVIFWFFILKFENKLCLNKMKLKQLLNEF